MNETETLEAIAEKLAEFRSEVFDCDHKLKLVPLANEDSPVFLAACESIGVTLIPITKTCDFIFLDEVQVRQLFKACSEFIELNEPEDE